MVPDHYAKPLICNKNSIILEKCDDEIKKIKK